MWFKIYADGNELDDVNANSIDEAIMIVKSRLSDTDFSGVRWTYRVV